MSKFVAGDAVIVDFQDIECEGVVLRQSMSTGYVMARIAIPDVEVDFGSITPRLGLQPIVCVLESKVRRH